MSIKNLLGKSLLLLKIICYTPSNLLVISKYKKNNKENNSIILFTHNTSYSGAPFVALNIGKTIIKEHELITVALRGGELDKIFKESFKFYIKYPSNVVLKKLSRLGGTIILNSILSGIRVGSLKNENNKVITLIHEMPYTITDTLNIDKTKLDEVRELSDFAIFPTSYNKDIFIKEIGSFKNKVIVRPQGLYNRLNDSFLKEEAKLFLKDKYDIATDTYIYMGCGNITERKGFDFFTKLARDYTYTKKIAFIWVGDDDEGYIERLKKNEGIELPNNLIIASNIRDKSELAKLYISSECLLLTSRQDPFPSTILEAFSLGRPVVAFDKCGGYVEIVNKDTGYLVEPYDLDSYSKIINEFDNRNPRYLDMSNSCKKLIKDSFDFDQYVSYLLNL